MGLSNGSCVGMNVERESIGWWLGVVFLEVNGWVSVVEMEKGSGVWRLSMVGTIGANEDRFGEGSSFDGGTSKGEDEDFTSSR
ncbi:hypothetical protein V6N11_033704 [Hibiscus sabdariffa]|uniref:Uncharacterized protein n=1 Tax=Hibiscus sabdariffa TaxID=183260 RepID=A0ABR2S0C5_9ROSI